jgi:hypothetical protein
LNSSHEGVERRTSVALPEVGGGEAADDAINAETTHGLVAQAEAGRRVTPHDEAPPANDGTMLVNGKDARPKGFASTTGENAKVVRVLEVLGKHDVAVVEESSQL